MRLPQTPLRRSRRGKGQDMEPILMVRTAAVLLTLTALGGLAMAGIRFAGDKQRRRGWRCCTACSRPRR